MLNTTINYWILFNRLNLRHGLESVKMGLTNSKINPTEGGFIIPSI